MICSCLRRAVQLSTRPVLSPLAARPFSNAVRARNTAAAAAAAPAPAATRATHAVPPKLKSLDPPSTPAAADDKNKAVLSSCPAGTVLNGLNFFKGKTDPVALPDEEYPAWLWNCLEVQKKADASDDDDAGDEFSKSKKQRRMAAKRRQQLEAKMLATGDLEALAPKIPLQHQSINLPGREDGGLDDALAAADKREELRKAMRKERRAKIKESNYLKSM
ncbi:hypothetical protein P8C59_007804 [Phyllachora maydis]|uniref:Large ribosomal subunit protein mL54 n=1 Tax=Phyllachora maydis TaxID=1825666 RepID=A0AAD9I984_9PEZI|nr:hypothetical protein P8C59_007804 [Phyllachora maydis]